MSDDITDLNSERRTGTVEETSTIDEMLNTLDEVQSEEED